MLDHLDIELGAFLQGDESRVVRLVNDEKMEQDVLGLKLGKFGAFIGCSNLE